MGDGSYNYEHVQFVCFDSIRFYNGDIVKVEYVIIDTIFDLPCGITWSSYRPDNKFENQEIGCLYLFGVTEDTVGQYNPVVQYKVKLDINGIREFTFYDTTNLTLRVAVRGNICSECPNIDTSDNATLQTATCRKTDSYYYIDYCMEPSNCEPKPCTGLDEITSISNFNFFPNPTNNKATISFTSDNSATYTIRIINMYGYEVWRETLNAATGLNVDNLNVSTLASGVYIFTITDGKNVTTKRFVVDR